MTRETLGLRFQLNETTEAGTFTGMASVFDVLIDAWIPTRIKAGAFAKTLKDTSRVKVLREHQDLIGRPLELAEKATGLWIKGEIVTAIERGKDTLALMRAGVLDEMSIGFDPVEYHMTKDPETGVDVRVITELKLWEVSIVTWGANREAKIESVHAAAARPEVPGWFRALLPVVAQPTPAAGWPEAEQAIARRAVAELASRGLVPTTAMPATGLTIHDAGLAPAELAARKAALQTKLAALSALRPVAH